MSWWMWVLLYLLIFILFVTVMVVLGLGLWRRIRALAGDLSTAAERLSAVSDELQRLQDRTSSEAKPAAVFDSPTRLRAQRFSTRTKPKGSGRRTGP